MKKRHYRWYSATYRLNEKIDRKLTTLGKAVFLCAFDLIFFGLNTRVSMLFLVFAVSLALLAADFFSLFFKSFDFEIERFLPDCVEKGATLKYSVKVIFKEGTRDTNALFYSEIPANPLPTFDVFSTTKEPGEEKRNRYDRKMGYYRWKWLIAKNCGGEFREFPVKGRMTDGEIVFNAEFLPTRRGKIRFRGAYIFYTGIFGLLKKGKIVENIGDFVVLPEIDENFEIPQTDGGVSDEKSEKIRETAETGSGLELKTLRDFVPGDSIRNIHWKSSAKSGQLRTKEFFKETDSGAVVFVDNFFEERYSEEFEKILSAAASLLNAMQKTGTLPQFLMVGEDLLELSDSSGKNLAKALFALAAAENNPVSDFNKCLKLLIENGEGSSRIFFFTTKYDESRVDVVKRLYAFGAKVTVFYTGEGKSFFPGNEIKVVF